MLILSLADGAHPPFAHADALEIFSPSEGTLPLLLTLRDNFSLPSSPPLFLDLPWDKDLPLPWPTTLIRSFHDFEKTPKDLDALFHSMQSRPAHLYKIAAMAKSANDALRLLLFKKKHPSLSVIAMGAKGSFARCLAPIFGNFLNYSYPKGRKPTAPGQISAADLCRIYRFRSLNPATAIYGLIGSPVDKSQGHLYHNALFQKQGKDAIYVKIPLEPHELQEFFPLAKQLGFSGLSVTAPLKTAVLPFLDAIDADARAIGAVNTLLFKDGKIFGFNTDGKAALDALKESSGKKMLILGAGGASAAIAFEAKRRGAHVSIWSRTEEKGRLLAERLGVHFCKRPSPDYDILVNTTPFIPEAIAPFSLAMDIAYRPKYSPFLKQASKAGCRLVFGKEMFVRQAAAQNALWSVQHVIPSLQSS